MINVLKKRKLLVVVLLGYALIFVVDSSMFKGALSTTGYYLIEMLQIMPVILMFTIGIDVLISKDVIISQMGQDSGIKGNVLALVLGSISAGPIYAAFPIAKLLHKKGASIGNIVIILSAWAVIKVPMLANEAKFLGPQFMAIRWGLTVVMILIMGAIINRMKITMPESQVEAVYVEEADCIGCGACAKTAPMIFEMVGKKAIAKDAKNLANFEIGVEKAIRVCPSNAIKYN